MADLPLRDNIPTPFDAVAPGPRSVNWRSDAPATLVWVEARDGGDPRVEAEVRESFVAAIDAREAAGETLDNRLISIERAAISEISVEGRVARITVRFDADIAAILLSSGADPHCMTARDVRIRGTEIPEGSRAEEIAHLLGQRRIEEVLAAPPEDGIALDELLASYPER